MARTLATGGERIDRGLPQPRGGQEPVVEIGLFLTNRRMEELLDLSRSRGESVGQLIRSLIDRELIAAAAPS